MFDHAVHVVDGLHIDLTQLDQLEEFCNMSNPTLSTVSDTDGQCGALQECLAEALPLEQRHAS